MYKSLSQSIVSLSSKRIFVVVLLVSLLFIATFSSQDDKHFSVLESSAIQSVVNHLDSTTIHYNMDYQKLLDASRDLYTNIDDSLKQGEDLNRILISLLGRTESTIMILDLNFKVIHASIPSLVGTELRKSLSNNTIQQLNIIRQTEADYFVPIDYNEITQELCSFYYKLSSTGLNYVVVAKHLYAVNNSTMHSVKELNNQLSSSAVHYKSLSINNVSTNGITNTIKLNSDYFKGNTWTIYYQLDDQGETDHYLEITVAFAPIRLSRISYVVIILLFIVLSTLYFTKIFYRKILRENFDKPLQELLDQMKSMHIKPSPFFRGANVSSDYLNFATLKQSISTILLELHGFKQTRMKRENQLNTINVQLEIHKNELELKKNLLDQLHTELEAAIIKNEHSYYVTVKALSRAIEYKDVLIHGHSERVEKLAVAMGHYLKLSGSEITALQLGSLLHDIGKIGLSEDVLKRRGYINDDHYHHIQNHAQIGYDIVKELSFLKDARLIILQHHEHVDGNGYPLRLKSEQINYLARIVGICDAFDAMTSERSYRDRPLSQSEALEELYNKSDKQFDKSLVILFDKMLRERRDLWHKTTEVL